MTFYDYTVSRYLVGTSFEALIMAAMRGADTTNLALLREAWPDVWNELEARYNAPGGVLDGDPEYVKAQAGGRGQSWPDSSPPLPGSRSTEHPH
jgi:hypothetical protein